LVTIITEKPVKWLLDDGEYSIGVIGELMENILWLT